MSWGGERKLDLLIDTEVDEVFGFESGVSVSVDFDHVGHVEAGMWFEPCSELFESSEDVWYGFVLNPDGYRESSATIGDEHIQWKVTCPGQSTSCWVFYDVNHQHITGFVFVGDSGGFAAVGRPGHDNLAVPAKRVWLEMHSRVGPYVSLRSSG
jgi:hypothetical protein